ncbi:methyl-accepting chemotaxis protein [Duganella sp. CF458]|uniref:methyl-accepting chemotaxis protein n=1 Tax=Duganella sp. CF458 TaxID=1884368 RepID=UPI0008EBF2C1|nr:methyl-accepting chemotaxis protein [Duganella sp. CF458]SFF63221.1 methyl-accepting chemotaxis protein [Duganella sp. CF458]
MSFSNMNIGVKLAIGFALAIAIQLAMSLTGISRLSHNAGLTDRLISDRYLKVQLTNEMRSYSNRSAQALRNAMLAPDKISSDGFLASMAEADKAGAAAAEKLQKVLVLDEAKKLFADETQAFEAFRVKRDEVLKLLKDGDQDSAVQTLFKQAIPLQNAYFGKLDAILAQQNKLMTEDGEEATKSASNATMLMVGLLVLATLLSIVAGYLITRSVTGPLLQAVEVAETVAQGDLTADIDTSRQDETGRLLHALKDMVASLKTTVGSVRASTDTINTAAAEIAAGNLDLSRRTEQQAASLEETASSMEELTSTVRQNADNARQANQLVVSAASHASEGGQVVGEVVDTMGGIKASSARMADIISVIDGIAFQTNILALNAAVEAARAGEQGRGFAVVASEVRNLAQRSAAAAKEIKELIDDSIAKVDAGGALVDRAGATMQQIVASVQQVADIMNEITSASQEQSSGIEQVNTAIVEMDNATQQNAALVEQAAAAARSMQEQSERLVEAVAVFRMEGSAGAYAAARAPAASTSTAVSVPVRATVPPLRAARGTASGSGGRNAASPTRRPAAASKEAAARDAVAEDIVEAQVADTPSVSTAAARSRASAAGAGGRASAARSASAKPAPAPARATPPGDDWEEF